MSNVTFDDFTEEGSMEVKNIQPIFTQPVTEALAGDEAAVKKLHKWLVDDFTNKLQDAQPRLRKYRENVALYKGIHYRSQETRSQNFRMQDGETTIRSPKVVFNWIYDMVENKAARQSRYKPAIAFMPNNDEFHDKNNARVAKMLVDNRWYEVDVDTVMRKHTKATLVYGEAYIKVFWNPDIGETLPQIKELLESGAITPEQLKTGAVIKDKNGVEVQLREDLRIGDVDYRVLPPTKVFPEIVDEWEKVTNITEIEYVHVDTLRAMYPDKQTKIQEYKGLRFDPESLQDRKYLNQALLLTVYFKPTRFMPGGLLVKYTEDVVLEVTQLPAEFCGELPFIRDTDIDVTEELHARSFVQVIRQPQMHYNNLASGVARNHGLASAPKWIVQKGSCKMTSLSNDAVVIEYSGPVAPQLMQLNPTPGEVFNYMGQLKDDIGRLSAVHGISQGELPPGVDAAVSMERLDEQEAERNNTAVVKRISVIKQLAMKTIRVQSKKYRDDDGRMLRILGKDNSYLIKSFRMADFKTPNDVRVQNTSALPESKSLRVSSLIRLSQAFPAVFSSARVIDMLDLGAVEAFKDKATVAVKAAESENESMLSGEQVMEPKPWEDLIVHYEVHLTCLQERQFKEQVPSPYQAALIEHLKITEYLMWMKATQNALFRQMAMAKFPQYPVFFKLDEQSAIMLATGGMPPTTPPQAGGNVGGLMDGTNLPEQPMPGEEAKPQNAYMQ